MTTTSEQTQRWQEKLNASRQTLLDLLQSLSPEQWEQTVYSEGNHWTVKTVITHLVDSERGMSIHVHKIRKGEETLPPNFDLEQWNAGVADRMGALSQEELLQGLQSTRAKTLDLLNKVTDDEWSLTGRHPARGVITIEQYYETIHGHELIHTADIQKAIA